MLGGVLLTAMFVLPSTAALALDVSDLRGPGAQGLSLSLEDAPSSQTTRVASLRSLASSDRNPREETALERWRGRFCPIGGCRSPGPTRLADIASFGGVLMLGAWLSRRRANPPLA